jgi:uncharacterized membrane protein
MGESKESRQDISIDGAADNSGQAAQAGHNTNQAQGEHPVVIDGNGNVVNNNYNYYYGDSPQPQPKWPKPLPWVQLPENYVERPEALKAVKKKLLGTDGQTVVVSAISGLGGLGKSVLATAVVLDPDVQDRFTDGILWVTLGQNPDLQTLLGDWIRTLDKSREAFSANTLESASQYLHTLLADKRMLLVVDDVWNAAHAEWFRVGGGGCRVLVTTREAQIEGAEFYSLDLMSEPEALDLVRQKLEHQWQAEQEAEVKAFVKALGYLPLALNLAANQVRDGMTWAELRSEFENERKAVALEVLDQSEAWDVLDEEQQRKYSLRACFNLSLRRLKPEQLRQFTWLGVLPEDANLGAQVAAVLWGLPLIRAKKALINLRRRSFLTDGAATTEGEPTYRVHDLMHDMARSLIECPQTVDAAASMQLPGLGLNLATAHQQFLDRYKQRATDQRWDGLPNDGYIHRHLTWHLQQANQADEIHTLLALSDSHGHNAWFEACDRIGQPAIFVEDVARAWAIAEQAYESDLTQSIVLQCRYALITATFNTLANKLPIEVIKALVKRGDWTVEQAWTYVERMKDEQGIVRAIQALVPFLSSTLFQKVLEMVKRVQDESSRASVLCELVGSEGSDFDELLTTAREIQDESSRASVLCKLAKLDSAYFTEALETARKIQDESSRASVLCELVGSEGSDFDELLTTAREIQDEHLRASVLCELVGSEGSDFDELLTTAREIQDESSRASVLCELVGSEGSDFDELLTTAREIQDEHLRASVLCELVGSEGSDFDELLTTAREIQDESSRASVLCKLAKIDNACIAEALETAREIQDEDNRASVLCELAKLDSAYFTEVLDAAREIQDTPSQIRALSELAEIDRAFFAEALETARRENFQIQSIQIQSIQGCVECVGEDERLQQLDSAYLVKAVRKIQDESSRALVLCELAKLDSAYLVEALETAREIQYEYDRASVLCELAKLDSAYLVEALETAREIQYEYDRASVLCELAKLDSAYLVEALETAREIQDEHLRASVLCELAKLDSAYFTEALEAAQEIQDAIFRYSAMSCLAYEVSLDLFLHAMGSVPDKPEVTIVEMPDPEIKQTISVSETRDSLSRLPLETLPYADWQSYLRILAQSRRSDLMQDLVTLYPAILHLGGAAAMRGVVDAMKEVCNQWK